MALKEPIHFIGQLAPGFVDRLRMQEQILKDVRDSGEPFTKRGLSHGDYGINNFVDGQRNARLDRFENHLLPEVKPDVLTGIEEYFAQLIQQELAFSEKTPIIAVDIGGMMGFSWCRLAHHFKQQVESGKVVFVLTNLSFNPEIDIDSIKFKLKADEKKFIRENLHLVEFIHGDSSSFDKTVVKTPMGEVSLAHNVDILHECASLTRHTQIPEWDISRTVLSLLSDQGIYFAICTDPSMYFIDDEEEKFQRQRGIRFARDHLIDQGLIHIPCVEGGFRIDDYLQYDIFKKPSAPKIRF